MHSIVDVFPKDPSESLARLSRYPDKNFAYWRYKTLSTGEQKQFFLFFMNSLDRVYYLKKQISEKSDSAILQIGSGSQRFDKKKFNPAKINFDQIKNRLRKDTSEEHRVNSDTRLGFKIGNEYLVKAFFTSGLRTVTPGTVHVVQTLKVPVLLYLLPRRRAAIRRDEKVFPHGELHLYDLSILPPMTANRIPPCTRYLLLTVQKTFFAFDVVSEDYQIPFEHRDPVRQRITKLHGCDYLDRPVKTPYIENVQSEPEEEEVVEQQNVHEPQFDQVVFPQQQQQQQQFTLFLIPPPERNVVNVSVDFAETYRRFKEASRLESEPRSKIPESNFDDEPLDLSKTTQLCFSNVEVTTESQMEMATENQMETTESHVQDIFQPDFQDLETTESHIFQPDQFEDLDDLLGQDIEPDKLSTLVQELKCPEFLY